MSINLPNYLMVLTLTILAYFIVPHFGEMSEKRQVELIRECWDKDMSYQPSLWWRGQTRTIKCVEKEDE